MLLAFQLLVDIHVALGIFLRSYKILSSLPCSISKGMEVRRASLSL